MSHADCDHAHLICNVVWSGASLDSALIERHARAMRDAIAALDAEYPPTNRQK